MDPINLEPKHSTNEIPGKCIKCLAEQELNNCLLDLFKQEGEDKQLEERFEALVNFLKSPESLSLRDKAEKNLADGKKVSVKISTDKGNPIYELIIDQES